MAATGKDLKIAELIDEAIPGRDHRRIVSTGKATMAMIINGLGFSNRQLARDIEFFRSSDN